MSTLDVPPSSQVEDTACSQTKLQEEESSPTTQTPSGFEETTVAETTVKEGTQIGEETAEKKPERQNFTPVGAGMPDITLLGASIDAFLPVLNRLFLFTPWIMVVILFLSLYSAAAGRPGAAGVPTWLSLSQPFFTLSQSMSCSHLS